MAEQDLTNLDVETPVGVFKVYVKGDLKTAKAFILTVHDLGCNHSMYSSFVNHESMKSITSNVAWINVDLPGQDENAPDLAGGFPSMKEMGEQMNLVLEKLGVKTVVCFGEGAGANILARFALKHPLKVHGLVLIHCTGTTAGWKETVKDKVMEWQLDHLGMTDTTSSYLLFHRFGPYKSAQNKEELDKVVTDFRKRLEDKSKVNPKNLTKFVDAFMKRTDITNEAVSCPVLLAYGKETSYNHTCKTLENGWRKTIQKKKDLESLELDGVANVLEEAPGRLAESFQFFMQGLGLVSSISMPKAVGPRSRAMSMEEADMPKLNRSGSLSTSPPQ